jgi:aspartokinase
VADAASLTPSFIGQLRALAEVKVREDRALVTLVGQNVSRNPNNLARASQQLRKMPGGTSETAIPGWCSDSRFAFVVAADALIPAAEALHNEFFGQPDPAFFIPDRTSVMVASPVSVKARPLEIWRPSKN